MRRWQAEPRHPSDGRSVAGFPRRRPGKVLVVFALILPVLVGLTGMVLDSGLLMAERQALQNIADAAGSAAAMDLLHGRTEAQIQATVHQFVNRRNGLTNAAVTTHLPPRDGPYAGDTRYVQVVLSRTVRTRFVQVIGGRPTTMVRAQSVAGLEPSTDQAAIVVLEPRPERRFVSAGLEVLSSASLKVDGAILVNSTGGAVDENGEPAGTGRGSPYGIRSLGSGIDASDIRVVGGVDSPKRYQRSSLKANRIAVPDPFKDLPAPSLRADSANVYTEEFGGVSVSQRHRVLRPGVYEWIEIKGGTATFQPGIYVIRSVHPRTGISLHLAAGFVTAQGVMFYVTDSADFAAENGLPDAADSDDDPEPPASFRSRASVVITVTSRSRFSPLHDPNSPFDGILLYQRRHDRGTLHVNQLWGGTQGVLEGCVYAAGGHISLRVRGTCRASFVAGTMRVLSLGSSQIRPTHPLPPAEDVFLVQ